MYLTNPYGFLALLAIPLILLIHFLQRKAQIVPVSTLFLLQKTQRESASGRKLERLVNSVPLWLQLLMVLLLTWFLVQPRYIKTNATQRIAIVVDSSASMSVFKEELESQLQSTLPGIQGDAVKAEYWIIQSNPSRPRLYHGDSLEDALAAIEKWTPSDGATDPTHALRTARSLAGAEGAVLYLTDTPTERAAYNAHIHSVGSHKENCGFTGVTFETKDDKLFWKTLVKNYSSEPVSRTWYFEDEQGRRTAEKSVTIQPGKIISLKGAFPANSNQAKIVLSPDLFTADDVLPIIRPVPKSIILEGGTIPAYQKLAENLSKSFPNISPSKKPEDTDIKFITLAQLETTESHSVSFTQPSTQGKKYLTGPILAEKHPLILGLNWQSLLVRDSAHIPHTEADEVLLWQGSRPLIFLRSLDKKKQSLVFNFDITQSNFNKSDSAIVLLLRYFNQIREEKLSHQQAITETSQPLEITSPTITKDAPLTMTTERIGANAEKEKTTRTFTSKSKLYAPDSPGFFQIKHKDTPLFSSATYFADTREADFSQCAVAYTSANTVASAVDKNSKEDHLWRYWVLLTLVALSLSWHFASKRDKRKEKNASPKTLTA